MDQQICEAVLKNENVQNVHYIGLFQRLQQQKFKELNFKEQEQILEVIDKILVLQPSRNDAQVFLTQINLLYAKFMLQKNEEAYDLLQNILNKLSKSQVFEENVSQVENFLYNFLLLILSKIPINDKTASYRSIMVDKIKQFKETHKIYDAVYELLVSEDFQSSHKHFSIKSLKNHSIDLASYQKSFHDKLIS